MMYQRNLIRCIAQFCSLSVCVMLIATGPDAQAVNRYVGPSDRIRTPVSPKRLHGKTLTYAFGNLNPGDTLTVLPGDYVLRNEAGNTDGRANIHRFGGITINGNDTVGPRFKPKHRGRCALLGHIVFQGSYIRIQELKVVGGDQSNEPGILGFGRASYRHLQLRSFRLSRRRHQFRALRFSADHRQLDAQQCCAESGSA